VYAGPSSQLSPDIQQAIRKLVQFQRVTLTPGHEADLTLHVSAQALSSWSTAQQKWMLGTGTRTIYVGPSSRELPLQATAPIGS
jgi:beta-glucosidase